MAPLDKEVCKSHSISRFAWKPRQKAADVAPKGTKKDEDKLPLVIKHPHVLNTMYGHPGRGKGRGWRSSKLS